MELPLEMAKPAAGHHGQRKSARKMRTITTIPPTNWPPGTLAIPATNLTVWPELMTSSLTNGLPVPAAASPKNAAVTLAAARLAVLGELESSLRFSQHALLTRDLTGLELATGEQKRLQRVLEVLWTRDATPRTSATISELQDSPDLVSPDLTAELREVQLRVLHLGRVQAALLAREQRWLTTLANLVAGPESGYASAGVRHTAAGIDGR